MNSSLQPPFFFSLYEYNLRGNEVVTELIKIHTSKYIRIMKRLIKD